MYTHIHSEWQKTPDIPQLTWARGARIYLTNETPFRRRIEGRLDWRDSRTLSEVVFGVIYVRRKLGKDWPRSWNIDLAGAIKHHQAQGGYLRQRFLAALRKNREAVDFVRGNRLRQVVVLTFFWNLELFPSLFCLAQQERHGEWRQVTEKVGSEIVPCVSFIFLEVKGKTGRDFSDQYLDQNSFSDFRTGKFRVQMP